MYVTYERHCYTMQLVSQRAYFENSSFMIRDVTRCNVSCNMFRKLSEVVFCLAAQQKYCETSCKRDGTLRDGKKLYCSVAAIVAKSRT